MMQLHPNYLDKNGKREFVVLPVEEYDQLRAYIEDMEDLLELRKAKQEEASSPVFTLDQVKRELKLGE
jgi:PHD/YefM family antitoxin component YafN of YafNO toxin-antitoxin module